MQADPAQTSAKRVYTLRVGDKVTIPAIAQVCNVFREAGSPELFCQHAHHPRHQVTIFADGILVWRVGHPDNPVWSGKA